MPTICIMGSEDTMQAAVLEMFGTVPRILEVARPVAGAGQALVRIAASGVNPLDVKIHGGQAAHAAQPLPAVLGIDLAGRIEALGEGVTGLQVGDEVYGMTGGVGGLQGSLAEYAAVDVDLLARKPANLSMRDAASLPLVFITAWEGLVDRARVHAGQRVLVHGGAGGIGQVAVQLARSLGAEVFATVRGDDQRAFVEQRGANVIDGKATEQGFDVVFDTLGGASLDAAFEAVRTYGHVVSALGWGTHPLAPLSFRGASYSGIFTLLPLLNGESRRHHGNALREATALVQAGKLVPRVDPTRFGLDTVSEAYDRIRNGAAAGKLVVDVSELQVAGVAPR